MTYDSQISFTLDTICPWTYLAKKRLDEALRQWRESPESEQTKFTVKYFPYQLYPEATKEGEDKHGWYKKSRYGDSDEKMKMFVTIMSAYGTTAGIDFKFGGTVANTLDAHRLIQHYQEEKGPEAASKIIDSLYSQYFEHEQHPSAKETLLKAAKSAEIDEKDAETLIEDEHEGLSDVKNLIQEQTGNGVDSVPTIMIEGKRRDFTLVGTREIDEYLKTFAQVAKEST